MLLTSPNLFAYILPEKYTLSTGKNYIPVAERIVLRIAWWLKCFESVNSVAQLSFARDGKDNRENGKHLRNGFMAGYLQQTHNLSNCLKRARVRAM